MTATFIIVAVAIILPFSPLGKIFGFAALPVRFLGWMAVIVAFYIASAEVTKKIFYRKVAIER
jgi:Mg2+-importing ATPase